MKLAEILTEKGIRKTNQGINNKTISISKADRFRTATQSNARINKELSLSISLATVADGLRGKGMCEQIAVRKPLLQLANKQRRLKFLETMLIV